MESRYYLFYGETPENTRIDDRAHALHITSKAWNGITRHLDRKRLQREATEKEAAYRARLKEESYAMTKNWEDSVENISKRKEQELEARLGVKDADKLSEFYKLRQEQEAQRQELVKGIRREMHRDKGYCKQLTGALLESEALYERDRQMEFLQMIAGHEREEEEAWAAKVKQEAEKEVQEKLEAEEKALEKKKQTRENALADVQAFEEKKKRSREEQLRREAEDNENMRKESEALEKHEKEFKVKNKMEMKAAVHKNLLQIQEAKKVAEKESREIDDVIDLYAKTKHKIECMKRRKFKQIRDDYIARQEQLAQNVFKEQQGNEERENELLKQRIKEKEVIEQEKIKAKAEHEKKVVEERIKDRQQYLERVEKERRIEEEVKKWEMLNRVKTNEIIEEYDKNKQSKFWQRKLEYRKELQEQIKENEKLLREQKEELKKEHELAIAKLDEEDKIFCEYADEVLERQKSKGRTVYPVQKVILQYCKDNDIIPQPRGRHYCEHISGKLCDSSKSLTQKKHEALLCSGYTHCKCCKKYFKDD